MAGEYVRWLARNEKPREKREISPEEKRRNWWAYHKWYVIAALVCAVLLADLVYDMVTSRREQPDYVLAYVGQRALPEELVRAVEDGLATLGEDVSGNGEVRVQLRQFVIPREDGELGYNTSLMLQSSIENVESMVFLLEDPQWFRESYPILCRADGSADAPESQVPLYYLWEDCPVLADLELPQELGGIALARRGLWGDELIDRIQAAIGLWETMTTGAE